MSFLILIKFLSNKEKSQNLPLKQRTVRRKLAQTVFRWLGEIKENDENHPVGVVRRCWTRILCGYCNNTLPLMTLHQGHLRLEHQSIGNLTRLLRRGTLCIH